MDDTAVADFVGITGAAPHVASYFLSLTGNDVMQAVGLFYDSPDLAANAPRESPVNASSGAQGEVGHSDESGAFPIDSDEDANDSDGDEAKARRIEADEAMARRMQEEMYEGADTNGVRAPIARRTETLVGPGADYYPEEQEAAIQEQMQRIAQRRGIGTGSRPFSQTPGRAPDTIWNDMEAQPAAPAQGANAFAPTSRVARLADMYRPPVELIVDLTLDDAKEQGKEREKWIMVNVQHPAVFDCQLLNRDLWKHEGIRETVRENFIFMQYDLNDALGDQYTRFYMPRKDDMDAYPYIAIIDPRTGEQVKVWSGPPVPKPYDFLMALHDFLDRYSLKVDVRNPVAKRKIEKPAVVNVDAMTEAEAIAHAVQASLRSDNSSSAAPAEQDPDELTKGTDDIGKGKGKAVEDEDVEMEEHSNGNGSTTASPFSLISSSNPHVEPANEKGVTGRIQFRHSNGRVIRLFRLDDPIRRIYEWLKAEPLEGREGQVFELKFNGQDLLESMSKTVQDVGLNGATVMIEYIEE